MHSASVDDTQRQFAANTHSERKARASPLLVWPAAEAGTALTSSSQSRPAPASMFGWVLAVILLGYLVPHFLIGLLPTQDLKKKVRCVSRSRRLRARADRLNCMQYGATWALVTGASSGTAAQCGGSTSHVLALTRLCDAGAGIGKSLAQKLAAQGLNVVLVALDVRAGRRRRGAACALSHTLGSRAAAAQEPLLTDTYGELKAAFPKLQFRKARADAAAINPTGGAGLMRGTCGRTGWREPGHARRLPGEDLGGHEGH